MILRRYGRQRQNNWPTTRTPVPRKRWSTRPADKNWSIRAAALEAISQRGDRSLVSAIAPVLDDAKDDVRFAAAACVLHLSEIPAEKTPAEPAKP